MPRFKKVSLIVNKKKVEAWINVDAKGNFSCEIPLYVANALGCEPLVEGKDAEKVEHAVHKLFRQYDKLTVASTYRIKYRIALSNRIRGKMPLKVMTDEAWKSTKRIGGEYMPEDGLGIIIDWFPIEVRVKGKEEVMSRLRIPDEDDWAMTNAEKAIKAGDDAEYYLRNIHKPYEGLILVHDKRHWEFDDQSNQYKDIPLTKETFEFFSGVEQSFVQMLTKLFAFLHRDEKLLMQDITKLIEGNTFKLIE